MSAVHRIAPALIAAFVLAPAVTGCGDDESPDGSAASAPPAAARTAQTTDAGPSGGGGGSTGGGSGGGDRRPGSGETSESGGADQPPGRKKARAGAGAQRAYVDYIDAINARDGEALCSLLPPNAERLLRPPAEGGSCAERLGESIGYEDPRGYAVWERTVLSGVDTVSIGADPSTARLTAAIVTEFADRDEPSVESDIAYLERVGGSWRLAQPTGALYRAIGRPELPPTVISPPG